MVAVALSVLLACHGRPAIGIVPASPNPSMKFVEVAAGGSHTCARTSDGGVYCWGENHSYELGVAGVRSAARPVRVPGVSRAVAIATGAHHTCAVLADGSVVCWGANSDGQLGSGSGSETSVPRAQAERVVDLPPARGVAAGSYHTCALLADGGVSCWGGDRLGQAAPSQAETDNPSVVREPRRVTQLAAVIQVVTAVEHTCALGEDGDLACWGAGAGVASGVVTVAHDVVAAAAGGGATCVVRRDHSVACARLTTRSGQPDECFASALPPLSTVVGTGSVTAIGVGASLGVDGPECTCASCVRACAARDGGGVACWGDPEAGPVLAAPTSDRAVAVAVGASHACALDTEGRVWCWGENDVGQLGDGTYTSRSTAALVASR
jgi:hypothetical protein